MPRSKLELYEDIIKALAERPLNVDQIAFQCGTSCILLQDKLEFLSNNNIIKLGADSGNQTVYSLTRIGFAILNSIATSVRLTRMKNSQKVSTNTRSTISSQQEDKPRTKPS